jgi:hypothetical protein
MPSNISIAKMGSKPFLDLTAPQHNGHNHAWLVDSLKRLDAGSKTKREICADMNITGPTLDKYIFVINLERAQDGN